MTTVTRRVKEVKQPRGGYVNPRTMEVTSFDDGQPSPLDHRVENIHSSLVGMAVDYLSHLANGSEPRDVFRVPLLGAINVGAEAFAQAGRKVDGFVAGKVNAWAVASACWLSGFDVAYRVGPMWYRPDAVTTPDKVTTDHILTMVERSTTFFRHYGPVVADGFTFPGGYTDLVTAGDGDFLTSDTIWGFKVSVKGPTKDHTLQLLMYWLMGLHSGAPEFARVKNLGVFNPRLNAAYRIAVSEIHDDVVREVEKDVIGY